MLIFSVIAFLLFKKLRTIQPKEIKQEIESPTLTNQEEKIAKLILEDKSNKEIADELFISLSTVKTILLPIY